MTEQQENTKPFRVENAVVETKENVLPWFNPNGDKQSRDSQIAMGVRFEAEIKWRNKNDSPAPNGIEHVTMATCDTEGLPCDDEIFYSFGGFDNQDDLLEELKSYRNNPNMEWYVVSCDLF